MGSWIDILLDKLLNTLPQHGKVEWIGIRPARHAPVTVVNEVMVTEEGGLARDRYSGKSGKRHVTLIQQEHLPVIASCLSRDNIDPALLRRNIVISGLNLLALKGKTFQVGGAAVLEFTGLCHPCSQMEETFGEGGYNAIRGHGGITARVIRDGLIQVGDSVHV